MRRPILYPYRIFSGGAHSLAEALDTVCVYPNGKYRPRERHLIICWGAGTYPNWWHRVPRGARILNDPKDISVAINKLRTFEKLSRLSVSTPPWTTDRRKALEWQAADKVVICRNSLTGSEGRGIIVADIFTLNISAISGNSEFISSKAKSLILQRNASVVMLRKPPKNLKRK
jgi:hypothetical protein